MVPLNPSTPSVFLFFPVRMLHMLLLAGQLMLYYWLLDTSHNQPSQILIKGDNRTVIDFMTHKGKFRRSDLQQLLEEAQHVLAFSLPPGLVNLIVVLTTLQVLPEIMLRSTLHSPLQSFFLSSPSSSLSLPRYNPSSLPPPLLGSRRRSPPSLCLNFPLFL